MKRDVACLACVAAAVLCACSASADVTLTASNAEIVAGSGPNDGIVKFAAKELADMLGKVLGSQIGIVGAPTPGKVAIVLGSNTLSRAAGIDTATMNRDEFEIKAVGGRVYIAGRDEVGGDRTIKDMSAERATLFGVYEFLHRYAGVRMYFPGELGTVTPSAPSVTVPSGSVRVKPSYSVRRYGHNDGTVPDELIAGAGVKNIWEFSWLNRLRHRLETEEIPCCHGQLYSRFYKRFAKTHPEYFVMGKDGQRHPTEAIERPLCEKEHLCHTSKVWDEIYLDAKAYLMGMPPSVRKIPSRDGKRFVSGPGKFGKYYDIMPHDGFVKCYCPSCQARYDMSTRSFVADLIWSNTVVVANRLKADGVKGYVVQMAYGVYSEIPKYDIPDNVLVMVAQKGPWAPERKPDGSDQDALVKEWVKKLGHKVWLWTYPDKIFTTACPDIPQMSPKSWGSYFKRLSGWIIGGYGESESDRWIYNYLNYYVFSRVCWDVNVDVDALLDEHYRLMYGPAAPQFKRFFELLEDRWVNGMMRNTRLGPEGPVVVLPGRYQIWKDVYSPALLKEFKDLFAKAEAAVKPGSIEARRVALMRKEMLDPLAARAQREHESIDIQRSLEVRAANAARDKIAFEDRPVAKQPWGRWKAETIFQGRSSLKGPVSSAPLEFTIVSNGSWIAYTNMRVKPGKKYRVSFFTRLADMKILKQGGGMLAMFKAEGVEESVERRNETRLSEAPDWVFVQKLYETPPEMKSTGGQIHFHFFAVDGKAQVDGLRLEEIAE